MKFLFVQPGKYLLTGIYQILKFTQLKPLKVKGFSNKVNWMHFNNYLSFLALAQYCRETLSYWHGKSTSLPFYQSFCLCKERI